MIFVTFYVTDITEKPIHPNHIGINARLTVP